MNKSVERFIQDGDGNAPASPAPQADVAQTSPQATHAAAHTPTPWKVVQRWSGYTGAEIRAGDTNIADLRINGVNETHGEANAALIVRAVNAHGELVAALRDCLGVLAEFRSKANIRTSSGFHFLNVEACARKTLAKAEAT